MNIHVGDEITLSEKVVPENTAKAWGSGSLPVYATPAMVTLVEKAAVKLLEGKLDEGMTSVGTNLNIAHVSATPVGGTIECHCTLTEIDRKRLEIHVEVKDAKGRVGIGTHERFIVAAEPFMEKAEHKFD
ncbi:MAG TPA: thioesterase [Candidatus Anaerostipes excrementavium]|uniref:Thioesterase n=1 Tax=Candidatus Anaerostipes excrementavium TaxID=2838463 RepID=A0A9D2B9S7_9FIRM|nr:hotdog domain-containing protein [uncultured Anaerostipes sp.]HIX68276.1 thioesterase [Candidatus Anaerostipes excrementavium]